MLRGNRELWLAFLAMLLITRLYGSVVVFTREIPPASELFGHGMGIVGFVLMLLTETLYSLRKRSRRGRWGRMSTWLQLHIFTGLVGPYMVLLHTSWKWLRAVRELVDAGLDAGVLMAPIVPGLTSQPSKLDRTVKAIADSGASHVGAMVMHLEAGTRDHFMAFLAREYPQLVDRYGHLYAGKYAPRAYAERVRDVVGMLRARYGITTKEKSEK